MQVIAISLGQNIASILMVIFLATDNYWAGLLSLIAVLFIKFGKNIVRITENKNFRETLFSVAETSAIFIVISGFGYAGIVYWAIIAPLLLLMYIVGYMSLRIGIATGKPAPQAAILESIFLPLGLIAILLIAILSPDITVKGWSLANSVGALLVVSFFVLTIQRARLAYTSLRTARL